MTLQLRYNADWVNAKLISLSNEATVTDSLIDKGQFTNIAKGHYLVLTGYYWYNGNTVNYLQTTTGWYVPIDTMDENWLSYWKMETVGLHINRNVYTKSQAQALVQKIINNNKDITRCNMLCARYADRFSQTQLAQIKALQQRVMARNKALQDQGLTQNVKTGYPEEYAELSPYLAKIMEDQSIGIATWVVVVIAATVIAATATAAYFAYKSLADESERDVKFSKKLTATLVNKLTPEEYQQLLDETKGMLTKSKIKSLVKGSWGTLKYVIMGGAALYAVYLLKSSRS